MLFNMPLIYLSRDSHLDLFEDDGLHGVLNHTTDSLFYCMGRSTEKLQNGVRSKVWDRGQHVSDFSLASYEISYYIKVSMESFASSVIHAGSTFCSKAPQSSRFASSRLSEFWTFSQVFVEVA